MSTWVHRTGFVISHVFPGISLLWRCDGLGLGPDENIGIPIWLTALNRRDAYLLHYNVASEISCISTHESPAEMGTSDQLAGHIIGSVPAGVYLPMLVPP